MLPQKSNNLTLLAELVLHLLAPIIAIPHDSLLITKYFESRCFSFVTSLSDRKRKTER